MSLNGLTVLDGATAVAASGGTSLTFTTTSVDVPGGINVADHSESDYRLRRHITFRNRNPQRQSDGSFTKAKRSIVVTTPIETASGEIKYMVSRYECEIPVEATPTQEVNHRRNTTQLLCDADAETFHTTGAVS